jgi:hypothetical protein
VLLLLPYTNMSFKFSVTDLVIYIVMLVVMEVLVRLLLLSSLLLL